MSGTRGQPVHLTRGERRLLIGLIEQEIKRVEDSDPADAEARHLRKLRLRQYRRLGRELKVARPEPMGEKIDG